MQGLLIVRLKLVLILALELIFVQVQVDCHLFVLLELHYDEWVSSLTLTQRRIEANYQHVVNFIWFGQNHKLLDGIVLNLVVVRLST